MKRRLPQANSSVELRPPQLGDYLRALREAAGLTRADLWERARVSTSYIRDIECGGQRPTDQTLLALAVGVQANDVQRRHLFAIRDTTTGLPESDDVLRNLAAAQRQWLEEDTHLLIAYFDKRCNFLTANAAYLQAFPGVAESGHMLKWLFTPTARQVLVDWETEARNGVNWFRGTLGRYRHSEWVAEILAELQVDEDFCRYWNETQLVAFGRHDPCVQLRDYDGRPSKLSILIASISPYAVIHLGRAVADGGPGSEGKPAGIAGEIELKRTTYAAQSPGAGKPVASSGWMGVS